MNQQLSNAINKAIEDKINPQIIINRLMRAMTIDQLKIQSKSVKDYNQAQAIINVAYKRKVRKGAN